MFKDYFSIGELSDLFNINTQTLRYYDSIGLFSPNKRDEETGYRYYLFNQLYELASIRYLRRLDYSIKNIDSYMKARKVELVLDKFKEQSKILHEKWDDLMRIDNIIQRKISFIQDELPKVKFENFEIRNFDDRKYLPIGSEEQLYKSDIFYFYPTIAIYCDDIKSFGAYIIDTNCEEVVVKNEIESSSEICSIIPGGSYLCGYHKGPYDSITNTINKMYDKHKILNLTKETFNFNIIDQFVESDIENYITSIQIRIED